MLFVWKMQTGESWIVRFAVAVFDLPVVYSVAAEFVA